jgi:uracil-DNA glycosylase family protein
MPRKAKTPEQSSAADFMPPEQGLTALKGAAARCRGCDLYKDATQTVFGEGPRKSPILFVGEQPGDAEDKEGRPFVGPAGRLLDKALAESGIEREQMYFTNVVKHFRFEWRGQRRLHKKPRQIEVNACLPWLMAEISQVQPQIVVLLGATAAQALLGKEFRITQSRGQYWPSSLAPYVMATVHPSSILRAVDADSRHKEMAHFIEDLKIVAATLAGLK